MQVGAVLWRLEDCERALWELPLSPPVRGALPSCRVGAAEGCRPCERLPEGQLHARGLASWGFRCRGGRRAFPTERCRTRSRRSQKRHHAVAPPFLSHSSGRRNRGGAKRRCEVAARPPEIRRDRRVATSAESVSFQV